MSGDELDKGLSQIELEYEEAFWKADVARPRAPRPGTSGGVVPFPELEEVSQRANERPNRAANNKARLSH